MSEEEEYYVSRIVGGMGQSKPADEHVNELLDQTREDITLASGKEYPNFVVHSYKTQVVAGCNYYIKIQVGESDGYIHVRIFRPLGDGAPQVGAIQHDKTLEDEINFF